MNYQRKYIERLAERIRAILARICPHVCSRIPFRFTKAHVAAFLEIQEPNVSEALGLLLKRKQIKLVRVGCRAFGPAVYRRV